MPESQQQHAQQEFNIREYWQILTRRRWMIYTFVLVTTVVAAVSSFLATPVYKSTCTISIERSGARLLKQDLVSSEPSWLDYQNFYNTQYKIIESDTVLRKTVDILNLKTRGIPGAKSRGPSLGDLKNQIFGIFSRRPGDIEDDAYYPLVKFLHGGLSVDPVRDSHLVQISFVSSDRKFASEAANAVATAYLDFTLESKLDLAEKSKDFFAKRINVLKEQIALDEKALQDFAKRNQLVTGDTNEAAFKNYDDLRQQLSKLESERGQAEGKYRAYAVAEPGSLDEVRNSPHLQELQADYARAESEYKEKVEKFGPEYPEARQARAKADELKQKIETQSTATAKQAVDAVRVNYLNLSNQVDNLRRLFESSRASVDRFQGPYADYLTQRKLLDSERKTLDELLDKKTTMELSVNLGETGHNVRTIDDAQPSRQIFRPKKKLNIMLGFLVGLFFGVAGAVLMEYIDNTLKTPEDVRQVLGLAVLGMIPTQESPARERKRARRRRKGAPKTPTPQQPPREIDPALMTLQAPLSPIAEAYRELRTAVLLATPGHPPRDLTVTSCQPSEGKTTTAINLAIALAQLGRRVLIVDTDLRRPRCHVVLRIPAARGVSTYLTGNSDLKSLIVPTHAERVYLLPAGPIPPNPAELLDAERFREMIAELRASDFDHVVFDSPPTLSVVDPLLIGRQTEGTVLVLKSAFTSRESGRLGKEKLLSGRVNLLGVLLNAVASEHVPYQYRYYRYGYSRREQHDSAARETASEAGGADGENQAAHEDTESVRPA